MKNYNIKSILLAGIACLTLVGCGDFLTIEPKNFVSEDNFWNEKTDIDQMVTGTYTKMQSAAFIQRLIMWGETRSDNITEGLNCQGQLDIYRTLQEHLLSTNQYADWTSFYAVINQCNIIIERAPEVSEKDPVYTHSDVLATQAEMTYLRALCYFYLVRAFKDVPYYTYAIQSDEDVVPIGATNGDEIVRNLIADLESVVSNALKAYPKDNDERYNSNCNRVTQNAIYALLADLCLWDNQYEKCIQYCQRVIDAKMQEYYDDYSYNSGDGATIRVNGREVSQNVQLFRWADDEGVGYPLIPCYSGNTYGADFNAIFGSNGNSFESIFELAFTKQSDGDGYVNNSALASLYGNYYSGTAANSRGKGYLSASEEILNDLNNNLNRIFAHKNDCRYYTSLDIDDEFTFAYIAKGVVEQRTIQTATNSTFPYEASRSNEVASYHTRNWIFYRLTDIMLMQAEALIESASNNTYAIMNEDGSIATDDKGNRLYDQNLKKAFGLIYAVNRRSIMTNTIAVNPIVNTNALKIQATTSKGELRTMCQQERRRELLFEGKRWFDLLRYSRRENTLSYIPSKKGATKIVNTEALYWPYFKNELKNNPLLEQKPFYGNSDEEGNYSSTK